ncbi:MAG: hypothetical protein HOW59_06105 [Nonomuraea sp.]|nr:hypothetical protein [Nonomuraea sp.]
MPGFSNIAWVGGAEQPVASAARTASGSTAAQSGYGPATSLRAQLNVTAAAGTTPTLDVVIEDTLDGGTTWNTIGTFTQATAVARQVINITTPFSDTLRVRWTVGGATPSFTFAVDWVPQA